ncbi:MAG: TIGR02594 family protein [Xanthobacteraceae bacterium]
MTALIVSCAALALVANDADARPRHRNSAGAQTAPASVMGNDGRYVPATAAASNTVERGTVGSRRGRPLELGYARAAASSNALIAEARKYLGGNPTGRASLWCGAFLDLVLRRTGHKGGGNLARGYARYGTRISGPQVGAIAVMTRKGGGHVGIVTGVDANGNVVVISGNHNNRVAEAVYPPSRVIAYVVP